MNLNHALCFPALALSFSLAAQGPFVGVKGGLNISNLYRDDASDKDVRSGFHAGFVGRAMADQPIGLQAELLYSTKGNRTHYTGLYGLIDQDVDFTLNYIEMPVMAAFRFADNAFELHAGGYAAYLLSASVHTSGDLGDGSNDLDRENFNAIDTGVLAGVAFNAGPIQIGARYLLGLRMLANSDEADVLLGDARNSCAQVYIAFGQVAE